MPYTHITYLELRNELASRLDDSSKVYWVDDELKVHVIEALRTWGVLSGFWRERGDVTSTANTTFYDIPSSLPQGLLNYTVTDYDLIKSIQYALLENTSSQQIWMGTEMFSLDFIDGCIERRLNQFFQDTGIIITKGNVPVPSAPIGRLPLPDTTIDVRRLQFIDDTGRYYNLWREDEFTLTAYNLGWNSNPDTPYAYSVMTSRPVEVQLAPPPISTGQLEMLSIQTHPALDASQNPTTLQIFDDLTWIIRWGVLADLLGIDGPPRDPTRAGYCEQRYQQGVDLTKMLSSVISAKINGMSLRTCTVNDLDAMYANWQNIVEKPRNLGFAGWNTMAAQPIPDGVYSFTLDVVRKAVLPIQDSDFVQIGREQIDTILDYAEHLALFKVGGAEFDATQRQAQNFMLEAVTFNSRLSAAARFIVAPKESGQAENKPRPREIPMGFGFGTMKPMPRGQKVNA